MTNDEKFLLSVNGIVEMVTVVFIIFLKQYSKVLLFIQARYENRIEQAWNVVKEPRYFYYFLGGIIFAALLVAISVWNFKKIGENGIIAIVMIFVNIVVLITLGIAFWNPVFTALLTVLIVFGVGGAAISNS